MRRIWILVTISLLSAGAAWAQEKETNRLKECGTMMKDILGVPDAIPQDLLDKAECAVVFPSVKKFAFGIGGSYGRGAMVCRSGKNYTGPWGAPAMYALEGGNIGFQLGGQATDFVLLVMNDKGATHSLAQALNVTSTMSVRQFQTDPMRMGGPCFSAGHGDPPKKLAYQWKRLKQTSSTPLRSVPPATARPFPPAPEAFPVIAAAAKEKFWFNSHRGRVPRVAVQVRGEH